MTEIIGVKFKKGGKTYFFSPNENSYEIGKKVIVETQRGLECGEVVVANQLVEDEQLVLPLKKVVRLATNADLKKLEQNAEVEKEALVVFENKIKEHGLDMKVVDVEYTFDNTKMLFYFTSDGRVDFRDLVRDLASIYKTRIELRQIGVRDQAKMLGGLGICGQPFCCMRFLDDFQPVSIKMAKEQGLSLNPSKISGTCGRLMCCLKYEQDTYEQLIKESPTIGSIVDTPSGRGIVSDIHLLKGTVKVTLDKNPDAAPILFSNNEVKILRKNKNVEAETEIETEGE